MNIHHEGLTLAIRGPWNEAEEFSGSVMPVDSRQRPIVNSKGLAMESADRSLQSVVRRLYSSSSNR